MPQQTAQQIVEGQRQDWNRVAGGWEPSTSFMSNRPVSLLARKRAARKAPWAKVERLPALWVISMRSPVPANSTVWSPTMSPPRTVAKPMDEGSRSPVTPWRA